MHTVKPEPDTVELFFAKLPQDYKRVVTRDIVAFAISVDAQLFIANSAISVGAQPILMENKQLVIIMFNI